MEPDTITAIALVLFAALLLFGAVSTIVRMLRFQRLHIRQPRLIWRDAGVFGLLALDFLLIAMHRALDWTYASQLWWSLLTSGLAIVAVGIYAYFEMFVVGHVREQTDREWRDMTQDETEDRQFGDQRRALEVEHNEEEA